MCNSINCSHDHLDDDLSDLFGTPDTVLGPRAICKHPNLAAPFTPGATNMQGDLYAAAFAQAALDNATSTVTFEEKCDKCRGTGRFTSYSGRVLGDCFACKGAGVRRYKQSAEQRAKARDAADARKAKAAATAAEQAAAWLEANPVEAEWLRQPVTGDFTFHADMFAALVKYGHLTEKQEAAVRNAAAKSAARKAQWAAEKAAREAGAAVLSMAKIRSGFDSALRHLKRPKLRIADIQFSLAPASGQNAGCIYVVRASDDTYLGKITLEDKFLRSRECAEADAETVARVAADPKAAAEAHGHEYGQCSCCGRELTDPESVARGIGPVCQKRWGW